MLCAKNRKCRRIERPTELVALDFIAALAAEVIELADGLNTLGNDLQAQIVRQPNDGNDNYLAVFILVEVPHE